ncbi:MAG: SLC13 family permease, partial [Anaerolineae bacterium]|nr:SLC13 family permease [Anaerolineae bacterium]
MTLQIAIVLIILILAVVLFVSEKLRIDVVALMVLISLTLTGLVTPIEAVSGFSNSAVITVWAVFILGGGLSRTGVANIVGRHILRLAGSGEVRLIFVIMLTAGVLSGFMNNVGVAALLLPVVMDIARRTGRSPSKLLMPLAYGSLLGGLTTLIGTPPNILVSDALGDYGLRPFQLFDFTPLGLIIMLTGVIFMAFVGRHLLPARDPTRELAGSSQNNLEQVYDLHKRLFVMPLPTSSILMGKTLAESRLGAALDLNVIGIIRNGQIQLAPDPNTTLQPNDKLLVEGLPNQVAAFRNRQHLIVEENDSSVEKLVSTEIEVAEVGLSPRSRLLGQTLEQIGFRHRFGVNVLAIWRDGTPRRSNLRTITLQIGDTLLVQGSQAQLDKLRDVPEFLISNAEAAEIYQLQDHLLVLRIPPESTLVGKTLLKSHLGDAFGLTALEIVRGKDRYLVPDPTMQLEADDTILVEGRAEDLSLLGGLQDLQIEPETSLNLSDLESEQIGLAEVVLSPYTTLAGKTLRQLHFREKYSLSVLAIWHAGQAYRSNLRDRPLHFGDALLVHGPREKLKVLGSEPDFLMLTEAVQEAPQLNKAPLALLVMGIVIVPVLLGWLPIFIAAVMGATLMVLTTCLTMEEAYRFIEWKAVFLIAGMLPLGIAMQNSGAAQFLAEGVVTTVGQFGPLAVIAGLFMLTALSAQVMPTAAVAVLLAPIAL